MSEILDVLVGVAAGGWLAVNAVLLWAKNHPWDSPEPLEPP